MLQPALVSMIIVKVIRRNGLGGGGMVESKRGAEWDSLCPRPQTTDLRLQSAVGKDQDKSIVFRCS